MVVLRRVKKAIRMTDVRWSEEDGAARADGRHGRRGSRVLATRERLDGWDIREVVFMETCDWFDGSWW